MLVHTACMSLTQLIHLAQEVNRVACIREAPDTNLGQQSGYSESCSLGFF